MSKRNYIIERASDVNGGQYVQTNSSYNSGYEDGKKAGKEYCASEITTLREQVEKLEALVVMRCDLDVPPQFSQGLQPHEVLEPVTAEHCQWFVAEIEKLRKERETHLYLAEQNKQLKAELKSIDGALNDPRANLTLTTSEIIWELKEQNEKMRETLNELNNWLVCAPIATAEDMAQSFAHMQQQCELALS